MQVWKFYPRPSLRFRRRSLSFPFGVARTMNVFRSPRACLWLGRLVPFTAWSFWLVAILVPGFGPSESLGMGSLFLLLVLSLAAYILWVYFLLPELLFEGQYRALGLRVLYFSFAAITAGLGPVIYYFLRVGPALRRMAAARRGNQ